MRGYIVGALKCYDSGGSLLEALQVGVAGLKAAYNAGLKDARSGEQGVVAKELSEIDAEIARGVKEERGGHV